MIPNQVSVFAEAHLGSEAKKVCSKISAVYLIMPVWCRGYIASFSAPCDTCEDHGSILVNALYFYLY